MLRSTSIANKIFRSYQKAASGNDANAMFNIGACYSTGYGVQKNENEALKWCVKAAKAGSPDALFYLAENYEIGEIPVSAEMAFTWYHDAAKAGHLGAIWKVVCCYFLGYGTEKNAVECCNWKNCYNQQKKIDSRSEARVHIDETLLHRAVRIGNKDAVKHILRQEKGNIETKNKDGQTALHIAAEIGHVEIIQMLVEEFQVDIRATNNKGMTAKNIAAKKGNLEIAMMTSGESNRSTMLSLEGKSKLSSFLSGSL